MAYPALPDHRIPYDADGTIVYIGDLFSGATTQQSNATLLEWQDDDLVPAGTNIVRQNQMTTWWFFPEQREITAFFYWRDSISGFQSGSLQGSNDTTDGMNGSWETASLPQGGPSVATAFSWRDAIKAVSFTGPKKNIRISTTGSGGSGGSGNAQLGLVHLYGETAAGQMAHDLVFVDPDLAGPFQSPEDYGPQPLGTTEVRPFVIRNTSATRTATNINLQCNDADFTIAENPAGPWVVTINIASLGPGADSATLYSRSTTPAPGASLKPRFSRITAICDAGFFG